LFIRAGFTLYVFIYIKLSDCKETIADAPKHQQQRANHRDQFDPQHDVFNAQPPLLALEQLFL
jgi:hypothetical protein